MISFTEKRDLHPSMTVVWNGDTATTCTFKYSSISVIASLKMAFDISLVCSAHNILLKLLCCTTEF